MDDYQLIKPLGHGNIGTVFLAVARQTKKLFAMKVLSKDELVRRSILDRAATETRILSKLHSPFLPSLQAPHFETDRHHVLVLDYCSGGDLHSLRQKQPDQKFSEADARFYCAEVVLALEHMHKLGCVHRDLKPENILIQSSGHIMLTDFDLCLEMPASVSRSKESSSIIRKQVQAGKEKNYWRSMILSCIGMFSDGINRPFSKATSHHMVRVTPVETGSTGRLHAVVGTDEYIAPEILWRDAQGYAVDWWTLGVLLYELVYGRTPFKSYGRNETFFNVLAKEPKLPGPCTPMHDFIRKLLSKKPEERLGFRGGAGEVKSHAFFDGICWDELESMSCRPPYVPSTESLANEVMGSEEVNLEEQLDTLERIRAEIVKPVGGEDIN